MLHLLAAAAIHMTGNYDPPAPKGDDAVAAVYCGTGTQETTDSAGNTACVGQSVAAGPTATVISQPTLFPVGYVNSFGLHRGFRIGGRR